jgi:excisionase family DNA binding protein
VRYMTVREAAHILGVTERTIRYRCENGLLKAEHIGRAWVIPVREVERCRSLPPPKRGPKPPKRRYTRAKEATPA